MAANEAAASRAEEGVRPLLATAARRRLDRLAGLRGPRLLLPAAASGGEVPVGQ